jgi:hypothetical protein
MPMVIGPDDDPVVLPGPPGPTAEQAETASAAIEAAAARYVLDRG